MLHTHIFIFSLLENVYSFQKILSELSASDQANNNTQRTPPLSGTKSSMIPNFLTDGVLLSGKKKKVIILSLVGDLCSSNVAETNLCSDT